MSRVPRKLTPLAFAVVLLTTAKALAQSQAGSTEELQLPSGSPIVSISAMMPQELRVGEQFEYQIQVRNVSGNVAVHDLVLEQQQSEAMQIESSRLEGSAKSGSKKSRPQRQDLQSEEQQQARQQQDKSSQQANQQASSQQQQAGGQQQNRWTISMLGPGEERTIRVTAIAEKEGQANACLMVTDYRPALCLRTEFVKPDLELVKNAPVEANLCEDIEVDYYVKNIGTGNAGRFVIRDPLGKGLKTIDGEDKLEFAVDGLEEGEVRKFVASLRADRAGSFSSRAVAVMDAGGKTNSNKTSTEIRQADLAVQIDGPETHYIGRPANYTLLVANRGNAPAVNATLLANFAEGAELVRVGEVQSADPSALKQASSGGKAPTPADQSGQATPSDGQKQQAQAKREQKAQGQAVQNKQEPSSKSQVSAADVDQTWKLGTLESGEAVKVPVTIRLRKAGALTHVAEAQFVCGDGANRDASRAFAQQRTELIALPDLMLAVVDSEGTVPQGEQVSYTIIVKNQGDAADQNVQITAELPQGLEFLSAEGPNQPKAEGQSLNFPAIKSLEPGDRVVWQVTAKATGEGQVLFRATLDSKAMTQSATAEEPTRLVAQTAQADPQSQQQ